jgi:hypothetical protein
LHSEKLKLPKRLSTIVSVALKEGMEDTSIDGK